ncbi:hypothetical protein RRG08_013640 [Elysia crispata]|uniref:Uncharacterized protein n=1 Tax=Elysia crispata TaxID=231223 RepID=A0AAE1DR14_9GAST|nr:hypothetical protein RRG08_013640 [Elysia crispata]
MKEYLMQGERRYVLSLANNEGQKDYLLLRKKLHQSVQEECNEQRLRNDIRTLDAPVNSALKERSEDNTFVGEDKRGNTLSNNPLASCEKAH